MPGDRLAGGLRRHRAAVGGGGSAGAALQPALLAAAAETGGEGGGGSRQPCQERSPPLPSSSSPARSPSRPFALLNLPPQFYTPPHTPPRRRCLQTRQQPLVPHPVPALSLSGNSGIGRAEPGRGHPTSLRSSPHVPGHARVSGSLSPSNPPRLTLPGQRDAVQGRGELRRFPPPRPRPSDARNPAAPPLT